MVIALIRLISPLRFMKITINAFDIIWLGAEKVEFHLSYERVAYSEWT